METKEIEGKEYVLKEQYNKIMEENRKLTEKTSAPSIKSSTHNLMTDEANVMGLGSMELAGGTFIHTRVSVDYLHTAVNIMESMKADSVDLVFADGFPVMIGKLSEDKKVISGVVIAPKVVN